MDVSNRAACAQLHDINSLTDDPRFSYSIRYIYIRSFSPRYFVRSEYYIIVCTYIENWYDVIV